MIDAAKLQKSLFELKNFQPEVSHIKHDMAQNKGVNWSLLRCDKLPPYLNGNKGFKLIHNIEKAMQLGCSSIASFGGLHSNHLAALAYASEYFGFQAIAIVQAYDGQSSPTLELLKNKRVQIHLVDKKTYQKRYDESYRQQISDDCGGAWVIPEGGDNQQANQGIQYLAQSIANITQSGDYLALACGTGATAYGLVTSGKLNHLNILLFSALKQSEHLQHRFSGFNNVYIFDHFHHGGFAKISKALVSFSDTFEAEQNISLDPVYTAKLCFAVQQLIAENYFPTASHVFALHSGGLQGRAAMSEKIAKLRLAA